MICGSLDGACRWFSQHTPSSFLTGEIHGVKGPICRIYDTGRYANRTRYYIMFKRDWLHSFQYLFKKPGTGWGQTVNMKILTHAAEYQDRLGGETLLLAVMPKGAYYIDAKTMMKYVNENGTTRIPSTEYGEEGSCPSRMWTNMISSL